MGKTIYTVKNIFPSIKILNKCWMVIILGLSILIMINCIAPFILKKNKLIDETRSNLKDGTESISRIKSIVQLSNNDDSGTGFFITNRYILTAAHVAHDIGNEFSVKNEYGIDISGRVILSGYKELMQFIIPGTVSFKREGAINDWALIDAGSDILNGEYLNLGNSMNIQQTDHVFFAGYPLGGRQLSTPDGVVTTVTYSEITSNQHIDPGFSGGPMIISNNGEGINFGEVIGINIAKPRGFESIGAIALPIDIVKVKLRENGIYLGNK